MGVGCYVYLSPDLRSDSNGLLCLSNAVCDQSSWMAVTSKNQEYESAVDMAIAIRLKSQTYRRKARSSLLGSGIIELES